MNLQMNQKNILERNNSIKWHLSWTIKGGKICKGRENRALSFPFSEMLTVLETSSFVPNSVEWIFFRKVRKNFIHLLNLLRTHASYSLKTSFIKIDFLPWLKTRLFSFSVPTIEHHLRRIIEKAYPSMRGKFPIEQPVSREDVLKEDLLTLKDHCFPKDTLLAWERIEAGIYWEAVYSVVVNLFGINEHFKRFYSVHSVSQVFAELPTNTSSGYPLFKPKGSEEARLDVVQFVNSIYESVSIREMLSKLMSQPVVIFHRFTTKLKTLRDWGWDIDTKIRQVFGVSFRIMVLEGQIFDKFLSFIMKNGIWHSIGIRRTDVNSRVLALRYIARSTRRIVVCGDIKGIDKNLCSFLILTFFAVMMTLIPLRPIEFSILSCLALYHVVTPVLHASGLHITCGGNITGSKITALMNTFCLSVVVCYFYILVYNRAPMKDEYNVLGDDFILVIEEVDLERLYQVFHSFHFTLNRSKTKIVFNTFNDSIDYLGFSWNWRGFPDASDKWWMARCIYPERYVLDRHGLMGRAFIRLCSIIFQIDRGKEIYYRLLDVFPKKSRKLVELGYDPLIEFIDKQGKTKLGKVPLSFLMSKGWRAY